MSTTPSFPEQHSLRLTDCATALAHQTAERWVGQEVLSALWPEHFAELPCRLADLGDVLLRAAQSDLALLPWLAHQASWLYDAPTFQRFASCYIKALVLAAQRELLAYLSDPHQWFHLEAEHQALVGLQMLEQWTSTLARYPSSCPDPLPGQPILISWPLLRRALCDEEAADGQTEWRLCLTCGALWRVWSAQSAQAAGQRRVLNVSVHTQPQVLRMWSLVDVFCDWLLRLSRCSNEERAEIQGVVERVGLHAARAALHPQQQAAWEKYLEVSVHLAADHWLATTNHLIQQAGLGPSLRWSPTDTP